MVARRSDSRRASGARRLTIILVLGSLLIAASTASAAPPAVTKPPPPLTTAWWQAFLSIPGSDSLDRCDLGSGNVVFLAGTTGGSAERSCSIPAGRSVLIPLINVECSEAEEPDGTATPAELRACARGFADAFTNLSLTIDGALVPDLTRYRVASGLFRFTAVAGNAFGIPPGTTRAVSDGYWVLLRPLTPGEHTVSFGGAFPPGGFTTQVTYHLTVA